MSPSSGPSMRSVLLIALIVFVDFLGFSLVLPFLPIYAKQAFGASHKVTGAIIATFSVCQLFAAPFLGRMSDEHGRRPVLVLTLVGSALGFFTLAAADWVFRWLTPTSGALAATAGIGLLFLARAINGFTGGNLPVAQAYIADITADDDRAHALGAISTAMVLALGIGPAVAGHLASEGDFTLPAILAMILSLVSAVLCWFLLPETKIRLTAAEVAAAHASDRLAPLDGAEIVERETHLSAIWRTIKRPDAGALLVAWFLFILCFALLAPMFPIIAQDTFGLTTRQIGLLFTLLAVLAVVWQLLLLKPLSRWLSDHQLSVLGLAAMGLCFLVASVYGHGTLRGAYGPLVGLTVLFGVGFGAARPALSSALTKLGGQGQAGGVMGVAQSLDSTAYFLGPLVTGALLDADGLTSVGFAGTAFALAAVAAVMFGDRSPAA